MQCGQIGCDALPVFMFFTLPLRRNERFPERNHCFSERFHRAVRGDADRGERPPQGLGSVGVWEGCGLGGGWGYVVVHCIGIHSQWCMHSSLGFQVTM